MEEDKSCILDPLHSALPPLESVWPLPVIPFSLTWVLVQFPPKAMPLGMFFNTSEPQTPQLQNGKKAINH